ncbi:MAG: type II toxin-antitoxin system VapC family toxin [Terracidiphilus sp.]
MAEIAVLDSSAVLAVIFSEPGGEAVIDLLQGGLLSTVNLTEIHTKLLLDGRAADHAWNRARSMGLEVCFFDEEQARIAAELIGITRPFGLSLGDRACLALAIQRKATVYTTDRVWKKLPLDIEVEVIR